MNFIIEFYEGLDALNTIIFWGIIIVILLLIVFTIMMIGKKKELKNKKDKKKTQDDIYSDEIALPSNSRDTLIMKNENLLIQEEKQNTFEPFIIPKEAPEEKIEIEKNFKAEEHVMKYDNELFNLSNVKKNNEQKSEEEIIPEAKEQPVLTIPRKPYERNVLREMSLSQTSPIGIVRKENNNFITKPTQEKELQEPTITTTTNEEKSIEIEDIQEKKEIDLPKIETPNEPVINLTSTKNVHNNFYENKELINNDYKTEELTKNESEIISSEVSDIKESEEPSTKKQESYINLLEENPKIETKIEESQENAKFLEEVTQKLAQAEATNEIDRTAYEIQQEEDAIISYKELMKKKDSIVTIDEEDAVISIKELKRRKQEEEKLYNLTEKEENNEFIDELKKFRNDLN